MSCYVPLVSPEMKHVALIFVASECFCWFGVHVVYVILTALMKVFRDMKGGHQRWASEHIIKEIAK